MYDRIVVSIHTPRASESAKRGRRREGEGRRRQPRELRPGPLPIAAAIVSAGNDHIK